VYKRQLLINIDNSKNQEKRSFFYQPINSHNISFLKNNEKIIEEN